MTRFVRWALCAFVLASGATYGSVGMAAGDGDVLDVVVGPGQPPPKKQDSRCPKGKVWDDTLKSCEDAGDAERGQNEVAAAAAWAAKVAAEQREKEEEVKRKRGKRKSEGYDGVCRPEDGAGKREMNLCLTFASGSAKLGALQQQTLRDLADDLLKKNFGDNWPKLVIEGHTDNKGSRASNLALSKARAVSVVNYLIKRGVPAVYLTATGVGPDKPLTPTGDQAADRRVTLINASTS